MQEYPKCGRLKDSEECGYCWGLAAGAAFHRGDIEEVERMSGRNSSENAPKGACLLVLLSGAALPVAWEVVQRLA